MAFERGKIVLKGNGLAKRDFISMFDVCKVVEKSLLFSENETYNLGSGKSTSILEVANLVKQTYQKRFNRELEIEVNSEDKTVSKDLRVDISKIEEVLNFRFQNRFEVEINSIFNLLEKER